MIAPNKKPTEEYFPDVTLENIVIMGKPNYPFKTRFAPKGSNGIPNKKITTQKGGSLCDHFITITRYTSKFETFCRPASIN
ncbi:MAG: hypothetical protein ACYC21_12415 [Eubacteriales bacterium]